MSLTLGLLGFVAVGIALGLLGGGGSILAVPALVDLLGIPARTAVPMALPVVGIAAAAGAVTRWRRGQLRLSTVALFAACAMGASYLAARLGVGMADRPRLLLFGATMLLAAAAMWRRGTRVVPADAVAITPRPAIQVIPAALVVGTLTGILGVGGGFLIVPALAGVLALPMPEATATSLAVIALNTASAGAGFLTSGVAIDLRLTAMVTAAALLGMAIGLRIAPRYSPSALARAFAVLLVLLAVFTIGKELVT